MSAIDMAIAHRVARAIHARRGTPNHADQLGKDMTAAYELLETLQGAGLVAVDGAADRTAPEGRARSG